MKIYLQSHAANRINLKDFPSEVSTVVLAWRTDHMHGVHRWTSKQGSMKADTNRTWLRHRMEHHKFDLQTVVCNNIRIVNDWPQLNAENNALLVMPGKTVPESD